MDRIQQLLQQQGMNQNAAGTDNEDLRHTSETIYISPLALLKMLKHSRAGVPMEVMGLLIGEWLDEFTVRVIDVYAMPQSGTTVTVEAVDYVYQTQMGELLSQVGRKEHSVGWYHSHPGFGCWLSSVDVNTQQSFEQTDKKCVAVVIDPIQSVRGKVVIDAFRLISPQTLMMGAEPRQTTSNVGHLTKPSVQALIHGLNRHYYSMAIKFRGFSGAASGGQSRDEAMLMGLNQKEWSQGLRMQSVDKVEQDNIEDVKELSKLAKLYAESVHQEVNVEAEELKNRHVGKRDPKRHLLDVIDRSLNRNIGETLSGMVDAVAI